MVRFISMQKKGDTVIASYKGTTAQLRIYPLVLPT